MIAADVLSTKLGIAASTTPQQIHLTIAARLKRTGMAVRLVTSDGVASNGGVDRTLLRAIVCGRGWWQELCSQPGLTLEAIGRREKLSGGYVLRLVRLAFLDPSILAAILDGTAPAHISVDRRVARVSLPRAGLSSEWRWTSPKKLELTKSRTGEFTSGEQ